MFLEKVIQWVKVSKYVNTALFKEKSFALHCK